MGIDLDVPVVPRVNGVPIAEAGETPPQEELRQRACTELLRQAAQARGYLDRDDPPLVQGVPTEAASIAIERLLDDTLTVPEPSEEACRRYYEAHRAHFRQGERVHARHILYAVVPGVDVKALRLQAEQVLLDVRTDPTRFAEAAAAHSNCPSGAAGGELGWLERGDCVPEFAQALFGQPEVGVLPRLVHSRFGLHVVEVLAREPGETLPYEQVRAGVARALQQQSYATALRQYLSLLAAEAELEGVELAGATSPLVQ